MAESKEELKSLLIRVKEESEKAGLKLSNQKTKITASRPMTLWQQKGKQWKQWQTLSLWALKSLQMVTAAMNLKDACFLEGELFCSYEVPRIVKFGEKENRTVGAMDCGDRMEGYYFMGESHFGVITKFWRWMGGDGHTMA